MQLISKYRSELMGVAILWIMLYHALLEFPGYLLPLRIFKEVGYVGVDIFFLLSGLGIAYSLAKKPRVSDFFIKRAIRILPTYWLILLVYILIEFSFNRLNLTLRLSSFVGLDFIVFKNLNFWFIPAIFFCYFLSPLFLEILTRRSETFAIITATGFIVVLIVLATLFKPHLLVAIIRVPVYLLGLYAGFLLTKGNPLKQLAGLPLNLSILLITIAALAYVIFMVDAQVRWDYGLWWYPTIFMAMPLCIIVCIVFERTGDALAGLRNFLALSGGISLELYLVHSVIYNLGEELLNPSASWNIFRAPEFLLYIVIAYIISYLINKLISKAMNRLS